MIIRDLSRDLHIIINRLSEVIFLWYESFIDFFGTYSPVVTNVNHVLDDGTVVIGQEVSINFGYIGSICIFGLVLFCLMKMIGGVLKRGWNIVILRCSPLFYF